MSVGHVARILEERGIATVVACVAAFGHYARQMPVPRAVITPFPMGRPLGAPGDRETQRAVVEAALRLVDEAGAPGTVIDLDLPYRPGLG
ncbi:hypothetical protein HQ535_12275 [bacterium]|nr:hypothetical protein [bacterium]